MTKREIIIRGIWNRMDRLLLLVVFGSDSIRSSQQSREKNKIPYTKKHTVCNQKEEFLQLHSETKHDFESFYNFLVLWLENYNWIHLLALSYLTFVKYSSDDEF